MAEIFNETNPNVAISVDGPGTGDGFELFCNGETDISDASRPIEEEEVKLCEKNGIEFTELEVALDGLTVMTSPENTGVTCLNDGDLYALFGPESEGIETWNGADSLATESAATGDSPTRRWRSPHRGRNRAPTTLSSRYRASPTSPRRRVCLKTTGRPCATTTSPRRTTT